MNKEISRGLSASTADLSVGTNSVTVSETARRQIAAEVLKSDAHLSGTKLGPSFFEGEFPDIASPNY